MRVSHSTLPSRGGRMTYSTSSVCPTPMALRSSFDEPDDEDVGPSGQATAEKAAVSAAIDTSAWCDASCARLFATTASSLASTDRSTLLDTCGSRPWPAALF